MGNATKHRDSKLVTTKAETNYLVSEPNYHATTTTTTTNSHNLLAIRMKITQIIMNKQVFLGLSMLDFGKIVTYEYWNDYAKRKYGKKQDFVT